MLVLKAFFYARQYIRVRPKSESESESGSGGSESFFRKLLPVLFGAVTSSTRRAPPKSGTWPP